MTILEGGGDRGMVAIVADITCAIILRIVVDAIVLLYAGVSVIVYCVLKYL